MPESVSFPVIFRIPPQWLGLLLSKTHNLEKWRGCWGKASRWKDRGSKHAIDFICQPPRRVHCTQSHRSVVHCWCPLLLHQMHSIPFLSKYLYVPYHHTATHGGMSDAMGNATSVLGLRSKTCLVWWLFPHQAQDRPNAPRMQWRRSCQLPFFIPIMWIKAT